MKPIVIIAISVVCSVGAVIAVQSFSGVYFSEVDVVGNIVPFDCAKAWDEFTTSLRTTDNNAFQKLSEKEQLLIFRFEPIVGLL